MSEVDQLRPGRAPHRVGRDPPSPRRRHPHRATRARHAVAGRAGAVPGVRRGPHVGARGDPGSRDRRLPRTPRQPLRGRRAPAGDELRRRRPQGVGDPAVRGASGDRAGHRRDGHPPGHRRRARRDRPHRGAQHARPCRVPRHRPSVPLGARQGVRQPTAQRGARQGARRAVRIGRVRVAAVRRGEPRRGQRDHRQLAPRRTGRSPTRS